MGRTARVALFIATLAYTAFNGTAGIPRARLAAAGAALAIDVAVSTDRSTPGTSITSPSFSTSAPNELLLAFVASDAISAGVRVSAVTGGNLTWALVRRTNAQLGTAEIWRAQAPTPLSNATVTATLSQNVAASLTVVSFVNADSTGTNGSAAIGASSSGSSLTGAPSATLVTTRNNSWVFGVGSDFDNARARTVGPNQTMVHQYLASVGDTYWVQRQTGVTPASGTTVTINDVMPTTDRYNLSIVEVLPAPNAGATWSVAGSIVPSASGAGVTVTLGGAASGTTIADANGAFSFAGLADGTYAVTPGKAGFTFSPASQQVTIAGANQTLAAFTATAQTWALSGTVAPDASGTQITLDGAATATTTADGAGRYSFSGLANGNYTVTPSKSGFTFDPASRSVTINGAQASNVDFTATALPPDATPPSISMTSPSANATVTGTVTVAADASDNVGVVGVVFMLDGAAMAAELSASPYALAWNTTGASNGGHTLTAKARDAAGNTSTSPPVSVVVSNADTTPPTVAITAPANGSTASSIVAITSTASDNVAIGGVQFRLDGASLWPERTAAPYTVSWDTASAANGLHTITAVARDVAGNVATSAPVSVNVSNPGSQPLAVDRAQVFQTIDGFGVNANSLSWKNGELKPAIDMLADEMGASVWRVVFDMEDWEDPNDNADAGIPDDSYYASLYSNAKFQNLWSLLRYLNQKGIGANVALSFMGRVPVWMGADHIDPTLEDEWVEMMSSLVAYARGTQGVQFGILDPLNETDWDGIEGPRVDAPQYTRLLGKLSQKLDALGLSDVRLLGPNTASIDTGTNTYMPAMMADAVVMQKVDHFGFHNYAGYTADADAKLKASAYPTRNFWMTEVTNIWDIMTSIGQGPAGVLVWDAYDSVYNHAILAGRGTSPPNDAGNGPAPLAYDATTGIYSRRSSFYAYEQLFKFVPPGSVRIGATQQVANLVLYAFWHQPTGQLTIVGRNAGGSAAVLSGTLRNLPGITTLHRYQTNEADSTTNFAQGNDVSVAGSVFSFSVPAHSLVTLTSGTTDTVPPTVSMTSPTDGSTVAGVVSIAADASDNVAIAGVQFKLDGGTFGPECTVLPCSSSWDTTTATNGNHSVWAVARDAAGNRTTSSPVAVAVNNVDNVSPTVTLSQPSDGATATGAVTVAASASDNVGVAGVQFKLDGTNLGAEVTTTPYGFTWDTRLAPNGSHVLTAVARDAAGNTTTSKAVTVTVSNVTNVTPPTIDAIAFGDRTAFSTTVSTSPFSTSSANELLLALVAADDASAGNTVTAVSGGGLTWVLVRRTNVQRGTSEIWRAFAPGPLANISVTATLAHSVYSSLTVVSFSGVDTSGTNGSGAIGATGTASAAAGAPTASLTTTRANSWVFGVGNDWDTATPRTLAANQTLVHQYLAPVGDTFWVQRTTAAVAAAGTAVSIRDVAPTADQYNLTICEILSKP